MNAELVYLLASIIVFGVVVAGVFIRSKFKLKDEDYDFVLVLLGLANFITARIEWKYKEPVADVMRIVMDSVTIVRDTHDEEDPIVIKQYILDEATRQCLNRGIEVDDEFVEMLSLAIDYLIN